MASWCLHLCSHLLYHTWDILQNVTADKRTIPASNQAPGLQFQRTIARRTWSKETTITTDYHLSVIIPAWSEENAIQGAIDSAWLAGAEQVIVVDGGSNDRTAEIARTANCLLLQSDKGRGNQIAAGLLKATAEFVMVLHADSRLTGDVGQALSKVPAEVGWGCLEQEIEAPGWSYRVLEFGNGIRAKLFCLPYGDQAMWFRRSALERAGGFPALPLMEDVAVAQRLRNASRPKILPVTTRTSARRWTAEGVVRRTLANWQLLFRFLVLGHQAETLAKFYQRQEQKKGND